jgi:hypothetical protein
VKNSAGTRRRDAPGYRIPGEAPGAHQGIAGFPVADGDWWRTCSRGGARAELPHRHAGACREARAVALLASEARWAARSRNSARRGEARDGAGRSYKERGRAWWQEGGGGIPIGEDKVLIRAPFFVCDKDYQISRVRYVDMSIKIICTCKNLFDFFETLK